MCESLRNSRCVKLLPLLARLVGWRIVQCCPVRKTLCTRPHLRSDRGRGEEFRRLWLLVQNCPCFSARAVVSPSVQKCDTAAGCCCTFNTPPKQKKHNSGKPRAGRRNCCYCQSSSDCRKKCSYRSILGAKYFFARSRLPKPRGASPSPKLFIGGFSSSGSCIINMGL